MRHFINFLVLAATFSLCFPAEAQAYIDPGVGSLILQGLAAALVSLLVFWRGLRGKIKNYFMKKPAAPATPKKWDTSK